LPFRLEVGRQAERQIREASDWWYDNRPAAPDLFKSELHRAFELIASRPLVAAPSGRGRTRDVRRVLLARIRYHLYYRVVEHRETVQVLALWHTSRGSPPLV
jgi:plasmid stabilization system protein ParE